MKRFLQTVLPAVLMFALLVPPARAQEVIVEPPTVKLAQTGFKFLAVSLDPRGAAMADALTADLQMNSSAMFYNPASMAHMNASFSASAAQVQYIADINYNSASVAFAPRDGLYGVFGVSVMAVNYGEVIGTIRADNVQGYDLYSSLGLSNPSPTALAVGLGYARALTDRFSVGGHLRYAHQNLGDGVLRPDGAGWEVKENSLGTVAVDFGILYNTGFRSLAFAMTARNFAPEIKYYEENFELPLIFRMGVSMDMIDLTTLDRNTHSFRVGLDAERPRDFDENLRIGGEYVFMNTLALRAGYAFPSDEQGVSLGAGLRPVIGGFGVGADYAYTDFGTFGTVHRLALHVNF